ncbi:MAG TPA: biopolymer transporter ExbD [Terriglobales bacterium]|nr:biopolymer transporter ExbD [Terriglobales bacterium]
MQTAKERRRSNQLISNIDVIGFSSVLLVLLYLVIGPYTHVRPSFSPDVDMVKANHPIEMPDSDREDAIIITIKKDGRVFWGNDQIESLALPLKIKERVDQGSPHVVYFKVDSRARYRYVKNALDAVRLSGLETIAFLVEKRRSTFSQ